jgi:hypothetical protein
VDATRFLEAPSERFGKLEGIDGTRPPAGRDADQTPIAVSKDSNTRSKLQGLKSCFTPSTVLPMCYEPRAEPRSVRAGMQAIDLMQFYGSERGTRSNYDKNP